MILKRSVACKFTCSFEWVDGRENGLTPHEIVITIHSAFSFEKEECIC